MLVINPNSPFTNPEYTRTLNVVPFDSEFDEEARRQAERFAIIRHFEAQEHAKCIQIRQALAAAVVIGLCMWVAFFAGCGL